jgi:excinuclease ABC subunit A
VYSGPVAGIAKAKDSVTGRYLTGKASIAVPEKRRSPSGDVITIRGAREHNLQDLDVEIPLGCFIAVTGVSGSGKSTLIRDILLPAMMQRIYKSKEAPGKHRTVEGIDAIDKVIDMDQSPIGRTPRSNPATYTGVFDSIRKLFAAAPESKVRGYQPGRFSFNVTGGRCEACSGDGTIKIEMHFLPDVYVPCEVCKGARYNRDTLEITFKGKNIAEVLNMPVSEALDFFSNQPSIARYMQTLVDVGLGGDAIDPRAAQPVIGELLGGGLQDRGPRRLRVPRVRGRRSCFVAGRGLGVHAPMVTKQLSRGNRRVRSAPARPSPPPMPRRNRIGVPPCGPAR